jgi:hypothetical protein
LAVAAVVSPVEVRFLYALAVPLAVSAARGVDALWEWSAWGRLLAVVLLAVQAGLGVSGIVQGVVAGYRL